MQPKHTGITEPCSVSRDQMLPHEKGNYCTSCELVVHDFTKLTNDEIKRTFRNMIGQKLCGRLTPQQEASLNAEFEAWSFRSTRSFQSAFLFTLIAVFGLTLFSCSDQQSEREIKRVQETAKTILTQPDPEVVTAVEEAPKTIEPVAAVQVEEVIPQVHHCGIEEQITPEEPIRYDEIYGYDGGISYTHAYRDFLIETVPVDEYDANGQLIPKEFSSLAFPNPTEQRTTLELKLPQSDNFTISLFDMNGQQKQQVYNGAIERGTFRQEIDLGDLPAGTYLIYVVSGSYKEAVRVIKL